MFPDLGFPFISERSAFSVHLARVVGIYSTVCTSSAREVDIGGA